MGEDQADRTLWVGQLDSRVTEEILYELFLQVRLIKFRLELVGAKFCSLVMLFLCKIVSLIETRADQITY